MTLIDAYRTILQLKLPVVRTVEVAAALGVSRPNGSKIMSRLVQSGFYTQIERGKFLDLRAGASPFKVAEFLASPFPSYISLQSALFHHGMISQIPAATYAVSTGRAKKHETEVGTYLIQHIDPVFFQGFEVLGREQIKMASPEKALLDFFYLGASNSAFFKKLPELELPRGFSLNRCRQFLKLLPRSRAKTMVERKLQEVTHTKG